MSERQAPEVAEKISKLCRGMEAVLIEKNKRYGNSALEPLRIFSQSESGEGLRVRLDDKLTRVRNGPIPQRKNDLADIVGYVILLMIEYGYDDLSDLLD